MRARTVALLVAVAALAAFLVATGRESREQDGAETERATAEFTYFDGTQGSLEDLRGTPVVLNFWASWCPACVAEMPDFQEVHERFEGQVVFIGLNMQEVDLAAAERLVERTGVEYRLAHDPDGAIYRQFGGIAMPTTVFIDAEGRVVDVHAGALFAADLSAKVESELLAG